MTDILSHVVGPPHDPGDVHQWERPLVPERVAERITHRQDDRPKARVRVMEAIARAMREYAAQENYEDVLHFREMRAKMDEAVAEVERLTAELAGKSTDARVAELIEENERLHAELARKGKR